MYHLILSLKPIYTLENISEDEQKLLSGVLPNRSRSSLSSLPSNPLDPFPKSNMSGESLTSQNNGRAYRDMAPQPNPQYQGQPSNGSAPVPPAPVKSKGKEDKAEMTRMREGRKREEEFKGLVM